MTHPLPHATPAPSAHQDSVLRMALGLWAADARATITALQRQWVIARLAPAIDGQWRPFSVEEKAHIQAPLMAYIHTYRPQITPFVAKALEGVRYAE